MSETTEFLIRYGPLLVFAVALAEQIGLPIPALPVLFAAGAVARSAGVVPVGSFVAAVLGALLADVLWYEIGRRKGGKVLNFLCRISLEPDSCVRNTEELFARHGARSLVVAKFLPGFSTAAPPLAGIFGMRFSRFLLYDGLGTLVWAGSALLLGYALGDQLEPIVSAAGRAGHLAGLALLGLALWILLKWINRRLFLRRLRVARIRPEELKQRLDAGEQVVIVDLRSSLDFEAEPETIPGSLRIGQEELVRHHGRIPRDRDVILFCT